MWVLNISQLNGFQEVGSSGVTHTSSCACAEKTFLIRIYQSNAAEDAISLRREGLGSMSNPAKASCRSLSECNSALMFFRSDLRILTWSSNEPVYMFFA